MAELQDEIDGLTNGWSEATKAAVGYWRSLAIAGDKDAVKKSIEFRKKLEQKNTLKEAEVQKKKDETAKKQAMKQQMAEIKSMEKQFQTPFEKLQSSLDKISELQSAGMNPIIADRARGKAFDEYSGGKQDRSPVSNGFMGASDYGRRIQEALLGGGAEARDKQRNVLLGDAKVLLQQILDKENNGAMRMN